MKKPRKDYPLKKEVDFAILERLLSVQSTKEECASFFGVSINTILRRCLEHYGKDFETMARDMRNRGKVSIRLTQVKAASGYALKETVMSPGGAPIELSRDLPASVPMLIHLGKHVLGQKDEGEGEGVRKLIIEHVVTNKPEVNGNGEGPK